MSLFAERGYAGTTMTAIATAASVSPGLLYRYFAGKQAVVGELYRRSSHAYHQEFAVQDGLSTGTWAERTVQAVRGSLAVLGPHRTVLQGVLPQLLTDREAGLLSPASATARAQVFAVYQLAIAEARDAPSAPLDRTLAKLGYLLQLGVLLFWVLERSEEQRATEELLELLATVLPTVSLGLWLPGIPALLERFADLSDALMEPPLP